MKTVKTHISCRHADLIRTFFEANELKNVLINHYEEVSHNWMCINYIEITYDDEDECTMSILTYMALVHGQLEDMLRDYLYHCGIIIVGQ